MARCFQLRAGLTGFCHIFNTDYPVGPGCPNRRDDVLLVQYMLAIWLQHQPRVPPQIRAPMKMDGYWGEITKSFLKAFEERYPTLVLPDGRVDPITHGMAAREHRCMKIWILNNEIWAAGCLKGGVPQGVIEFPYDLIPSLFR